MSTVVPATPFHKICLSCGRCCCQSPIAILNEVEAGLLVRSLPSGINEDLFRRKYLYLIDWRASKDIPNREIFRGRDGKKPKYLMMGEKGRCPFLEFREGMYSCIAYENRPEACRSFECLPLGWFRKYLETGLLTFTVKPKNNDEAIEIIGECIEGTNAMMTPPDADRTKDPRSIFKGNSFQPDIYSLTEDQDIPQATRTTVYRHNLPRRTEND